MKKWLAQWFGGTHSVPVPAAVPAPAPRAAALRGAGAEVGIAFLKWLAGPAANEAQAPAARLVLDELARLAHTPSAAAGLVPRVPAVIPQLLRSLRDDSVSAADLSRQLSQDVVLVAEVIREANSPYYRSSTPVRTIEGAVVMLGQNGMRMLLARVAFRPIISMQTGRLARQVAPQVWSQSEKCALAASLLAPALGANPFEAYLAGLMKNVGLIVAFRVIDQAGPGDSLPQSDGFLGALLVSARALSAAIAREWEFPPGVVQAIGQAWDAEAPPLAQALAQGDRLATLRVLADGGVLGDDDPQLVDGMDAVQRSCFDKLHDKENDAVPD
ncbi:HDOD domain-containing protein [Massilia litorea]|uniref:HDOD domain-containing protein n=1 Tax=Massilia litorea TaxID=2769491 RepID=A0A7L9U239_9BURK|nr:HDOD domain-containing protein [Massilia litorea]QOL49064.1 HDOD domain-containing protein [Massilia litorea]